MAVDHADVSRPEAEAGEPVAEAPSGPSGAAAGPGGRVVDRDAYLQKQWQAIKDLRKFFAKWMTDNPGADVFMISRGQAPRATFKSVIGACC